MGHYFSPAEASAFYGRIADEITAACGRGELDCSPQLIAEMPPINWAGVIGRMPSIYVQAFEDLLLIYPPIQFNLSLGAEAEFDAALHFLNYPIYTKPINASAGTEQLLDVISGRVRQTVLNGYAYLLVPVLTIGVICFLMALFFHWRSVFPTLVTSWPCVHGSVVARISLIALITATSFPALSSVYLWPAQLFLVSGALFSCAACLQLSGRIKPRPSAA